MTDKAPFSTRVAAVLSAKLAALRLAYHEVALPWLLPGNPPESAPEWAIFGYFTGGIGERIIAIMLAQQFMRRGIHCKFLVAGVGVDRLLVADDPLSGALNGISQTECALLKPGAEAIHWEKDYSEARFLADGVDMHELVYSTVARKHALTRDKLTDPAWRDRVDSALATADAMLCAAKRIEAAADGGKRIVYVCHEGHSLPNAALAYYFDRPGRRGKIDIFYVGSSYTNYFRFHGDNEGAQVPALMMTRNRTFLSSHNQYSVAPEEFDGWYDRIPEPDRDRLLETMRGFIAARPTMAMGGRSADPALHDRIMAEKRCGRPVYCLFSQITVDTHPFEGDEPFKDLWAWLRATIDIFRTLDGILLMKPHIGEKMWVNRFAGRAYGLADFVATLDVPDNIIVLPADYYSASDMLAVADANILWKSTAYLEMVAGGAPVVMCAARSYFNEAMRVQRPASLSEYTALLAELPKASPSIEECRRAAAFLYFAMVARVETMEIASTLPSWLLQGNLVLNPWRAVANKFFSKYGIDKTAAAIMARTDITPRPWRRPGSGSILRN